MSIIDEPVAQVVSIQEQPHDPLAEPFDFFGSRGGTMPPRKGNLGFVRCHIQQVRPTVNGDNDRWKFGVVANDIVALSGMGDDRIDGLSSLSGA